MSDDAEVLFQTDGALGRITLNRPKALNALTLNMVRLMDRQLREWSADARIRSVAIEAAGGRAFCAGGDIRALYESGKAGDPYAIDFYREEYRLNTLIKRYPKPYIAFMNGIVMGGGVGVSVHGKYRLAGEAIAFAMPETGIGLFPDVGGSYFLPRMPGSFGMYLGLTGARLSAGGAIYAGVATHHVPAASFLAVMEALADGAEPLAAIAAMAVPAAGAPERDVLVQIEEHFSKPSVEGVLASLEASATPFAVDTAKILRTKSPTSLKVVHRQIQEGAKLEFEGCMRMEFRLTNRFMRGHDFYEGVRALIVDKDQNPKWSPATLDGVGESDVAAYFTSLPDGDINLS
jgi:enoyl-CoA hydratase